MSGEETNQVCEREAPFLEHEVLNSCILRTRYVQVTGLVPGRSPQHAQMEALFQSDAAPWVRRAGLRLPSATGKILGLRTLEKPHLTHPSMHLHARRN